MVTSVCLIIVILLTKEILSTCSATPVTTLDGYRYTRVLTPLSFHHARIYCNKNYDFGYLAHIQTGNVSQVVNEIISGYSECFRIGLQYDSINGVGWYWTDPNPYDENGPQPLLDEQSRWETGEGGGRYSSSGGCIVPGNQSWKEIQNSDLHSFTCETNLLNIESTAKEEYVEVGENVTLLIAVTSFNGQVNISLYKNYNYGACLNSTSMGSGSWSYEISSVTENDTGLYEFVATRDFYKRSASTFVFVQDPATIVSELRAESTSPVTRGQSTIECKATGIPTPTIYWTKSSVSVRNDSVGPGVYQTINQNAASLHVGNAASTDDGVYVCVAKNRLGKTGYDVTDTKSTTLRVLGRPTILRALVINWTEDALKVRLSWKPDIQTLGIIHTIHGSSSSDSRKFNVTPYNTSVIYKEITLIPVKAVFDINLTVCPDDCIAGLSDQTAFFNTIPKPVANASLTKVNDNTSRSLCQIRWEWTEQTYAQDMTSFKVLHTSVPVSVRDAGYFTPINAVVELPAKYGNSFVTEISPNSENTYHVVVSNFGGDSAWVRANGECVGGIAAPYNIQKPSHAKCGSDTATSFGIFVDVPDERNGPISCLFFIVRLDGGVVGVVTIDKLQILSKNSASDPSVQEVDEYIAASLPMYDAFHKDNITVLLGENKPSGCDIYAISNMRSSRSGRQAIAFYAGFNWALKINRTYSVSVVSTTPVDAHSVATAQSETFTFVNRYDYVIESSVDPTNQSLWWVAMAVVGGIMIVAISVIIWRCAEHNFRGSNQTQPQQYEIPMECDANAPHRNDISKDKKRTRVRNNQVGIRLRQRNSRREHESQSNRSSMAPLNCCILFSSKQGSPTFFTPFPHSKNLNIR